MRRFKDEIGAAQVAIKVVAAMCRDNRCLGIFQGQLELSRYVERELLLTNVCISLESDVLTLVETIMRIPQTPNFTATVTKDMYPFVAWFFSVQRLPRPIIAALLPKIMMTLETTLHTNDKARNSFSESAAAISQLLASHPAEMLLESSRWYGAICRGLWDSSKRAVLVRARAIATLATTARMMVLDLDSSEWAAWKETIKEELSLTFYVSRSCDSERRLPLTISSMCRHYVQTLVSCLIQARSRPICSMCTN